MGLEDRLALIITAEGAQAIGELSKVGAAAKTAMSQAGASAAEGGGGLTAFGLSGVAAGAAVTAGVAAAGLAISKFVADGISSFVRLTDSVRQFQSVSGASAEDASKLVYSAQALGVPVDTLSTTIYRLGANVEAQPAKFDAMGVAIARSKGNTVDLFQTFQNVLNRMNQVGPGAIADEIAKTLVGRGAQTLAPLAQQYDQLAQLGKEAQQNGAVVDQRQVDEALQYKEAVHGLSTEFSAFERGLAIAVIPALTRLVGLFGEAGHAVAPFFEGLGAIIGKISGFVAGGSEASDSMAQLEAALHPTTAALAAQAAQFQADQQAADATASTIKGVRDALIAQVQAGEASADAAKALITVDQARVQVAHDVANAELGVRDAQLAVVDAQTRLSEAQAAAAEKPLRDALAQRAAEFAVADAVRAHAQAVEAYGANSEEAAKAADAVTSAQLGQQDAARKAGEPDTTVAQAQDALAQAKGRVADAQLKVNAALKEDPTAIAQKTSDAYFVALEREKDARDAVTRKTQEAKVPTAQLKAELDGMIADLIAAGANPATVQLFQNLEQAVLATRATIDAALAPPGPGAGPKLGPENPHVSFQQPDSAATVNPGHGPSGTVTPLPAPGLSPSAGSPSGPDFVTTPPPGAGYLGPAAATAPAPSTTVGPSVVNNDYSVTINGAGISDPNELSGIIAFHQTTRR